MNVWKRRLSLSLMLVAALVILLPILAVLQYRLLGQVSQSERERMQNTLRASVQKFRQDFDRELTRAYLSFQPRLSEMQEVNWRAYPERCDNWFASAPFPRMVSQVYRLNCTDSHFETLEAYNRETRQFEPQAWPADMATLRETLEMVKQRTNQLDLSKIPMIRNMGKLRFEKSPQKSGSSMAEISIMLSTSTAPLIEEIPALVLPALSPPPAPSQPNPILYNVIVKLDLDYLKGELIPTLARRYFSTDGRLDYHLAVIKRNDPNRIIYQSDSDILKREGGSPDETTEIFALRMDEIESLSLDSLPSAKVVTEAASAKPDRFAVQVLNSHISSSQPAVLRLSPDEGQWQILLRHRAGSLEAVVASARRRNLLISSGILALLSASLIIIIILTRRAQRLAEQQMEFVAGITHELRTPLAVIRSAGENLADGVIADTAQVQRYGSLIAGEGRRLTEMVEQVLEFSGIQSGKRAYQLQPASVEDVIADALDACEALIVEGGFEMEQAVQADLPVIAADRLALSRALQNLLNNAIKYSANSRWIKISATAQSAKSPDIKITIEDHGMGIEAEDLPHIFEPFQRGRASIAAQIHGNGLGLSLVKQIITAHHGTVTVESSPGRGSIFTVKLPALIEPSAARQQSLQAVMSNE